MAHFLVSVSEVLLFMASLYGWGSLINKWSYGDGASGLAYPAALGIAALIAVGGILNVICLAKPPVLLAVLAVGLGLAIFFAYRTFTAHKDVSRATGQPPEPSAWKTAGNLIFFTFILVVLFFLVQALLPSHSFNFHDDFHVYLRWPVKMLQTGSLGGNPFDQIGFSSLGAQAFMHGMFLSFSSLADINAFDAIICLILVLGLLREIGEKFGVNIVFILLACVLALFINPQYVNVSSLYSGTIMLLGLTWGTLLMTEHLASADSSSAVIRAAVPCSLFYAALLSLKTTYVFLAPLFWVVSLVVSLLLIRDRRRVLLANCTTAAFSTAFLLPWPTIYLGRYIQGIRNHLAGIHYPSSGIPRSGHGLTNKKAVLSQLFSNGDLFWGNNFRDFLYIDIMLLVALFIAVWVAWRRREREDKGILMLPLLVLLISVIGNYFCYYKVVSFRADQVIRYSCPILIGAVPLAVLLAGWLWKEGLRVWDGKTKLFPSSLVLGGVLLICQLAVAGTFRETFVERLERAENYGSLISFPLAYRPRYLEYNSYALSEEAAKRMIRLQNLVPAGEPVFAWVALPMDLDYKRNQVFPTAEYGISNPLLVMPLADGASEMRRFFRQLGIRYFIWDYQGYGVKPEAQLGGVQRKFIQILTEFIPESRILYNDGGTVVFDIGKFEKTS